LGTDNHVADPGSGDFFDPLIRIRDSGWEKIQRLASASGMNILDLIYENLVWVKKFFDSDPDSDSGSGIFSTLDPG
jgi:hypothetical protein